ncbi:fibrinogen C domain-containing protein 1 [Drosophila ananassae]|uniref:fibrinogen C domain-containing protein 1 n=1 Tax=Drosophila ananassae TaxID=7217 RepID=UPI001CFFA94C|nr:fibrinogen C domain-containing protein 1 [Drosophila ananassae]
MIGSGWMEVFYKFYQSTELNQTYDQYINGVRDVRQEHFIGLEKLHILTTQIPHEVYMSSSYSRFYKVKCESFVVGGRSEGYSLKRLHGCNTDTESLQLTQGTKFSTFDRDQDGNPDHNWAQELGFGFWFSSEKPILDRFKNFNFFIRRIEDLPSNLLQKWKFT